MKHLADMHGVARPVRQELQKKRQSPALSNDTSFTVLDLNAAGAKSKSGALIHGQYVKIRVFYIKMTNHFLQLLLARRVNAKNK